jgi:dihydrofolate reductase
MAAPRNGTVTHERRKLVLQMQVSVDGFVGRTGEGDEWQLWNWGDVCPWDENLQARFNTFFETIDCVLLSRPMAAGYSAHWADIATRLGNSATFKFASLIGSARKIAFSRDPSSPRPAPTVELADRPLAEFIEGLKNEPGKTIVAFGGEDFARSLVHAELVDEFQFYVNPAAIGTGRTIFHGMTSTMPLELIGATSYPCGIVLQRYCPRPRSKTVP